MSGVLDFLRPAQHTDKIEDPEKVKNTYTYWRWRIFYSMFIGYTFFYFTRKSFTFAIPGLIADLGLTKGDIGLLGSILSITYGVSKFANGILSDRSNPRYFMAIGLFLTGILNICFGLSSSLLFFAVFWGLNGWFQGFGWPPCARLLTQWYSQNERGSWWSTCSTSHNAGAFIIPWIVGLCLHFFGWRMGMYVPGVLCIGMSFVLINRLRDTPQSMGLPIIEDYRNDYGGLSKQECQETTMTSREIFIEYVIKNKYLWLLAVAYFFVYVVRTGINDWTALFLHEKKGYGSLGANGFVSLFEAGGFFGTLCSGWASDRIFSAKRGPVNVLFTAGMLLGVIGFWFVPEGYPWLDSASIFLIGFMTFGPQMLIGVAAVELSHKSAVATSNGFVGTFAYLGAAVAGYPLGMITQEIGWVGFFVALIVCCLIPLLLLIPMWNVRAHHVVEAKEKKRKISSDQQELTSN